MIINRINDAIDVEYDAKNQDIDGLKELPLEERVVKGDTITNSKATFIALRSQNGSLYFKAVNIECTEENLSKFREGTSVILTKGSYQFELNVEKDNGQKMALKSGYHTYSILVGEQNSTGWQLNPAKVDIRHIMKKTSQYLRQNPQKKHLLSNILEGELEPKYNIDRARKAEQLCEKYDLNSTQMEAFVMAYSTENYFLIQGPPGSGKTWLLAHLAQAFADEGMKVLVTGPTHTSINNALQKTSILKQYPHVVKVGKNYQKTNLDYQGATVKNFEDFRRSGYNDASTGIIVGATCYGPCTKKLEFMDWDVVIFDEAGQLTIPLAVSAMARGTKFIFIGDHQQLPPIIPESQNDPIFSKSIFALLHKHSPGIMLDTTYRMNAKINAFPSACFYEGRLQAHSSCANWIIEPESTFNHHQELLSAAQPEVLFLHSRFSNNTRSIFEAQLIAECVNELITKGISASEIAIITPFRAQVRVINNFLDQAGVSNGSIEMLLVDTIERIQGQERDVVILSFGTSNPMKANQRAAFFYNDKRFNVALTRARKKRIVIAHHEIFSPPEVPENLEHLVEVFQTFKDRAFVIEEWNDVGEGLF